MNGTDTDDVQIDVDPVATDDQATVDTPLTPEPAPAAEPPWAALSATLEKLATRQDAPAPTPSEPQLNPQQIKEINDRLAGEILVNPLGVITQVADHIANQRVESLRRQVDPYRDDAAEAFVDRFKSRMRDDESNPALFKQVAKRFDESLSDLDLRELSSKPAAARTKTLDLYWRAAEGDVLRTKVRKTTGPPPGASAGGGRSMASPSAPTNKLGDQERAMLYRQLGKEAGDAAIAEIEATL